MRLANTTTIPDDLVRAIIREVCPANVTNYTVRVTNAGYGKFRGVAYACSNRITVRIAATNAAAQLDYRHKSLGKGYLEGYSITGRLEALLFVLAHEFRHLWQSRVKRGYRVWGSRGQFSERDADAYALSMLRKFRRGELKGLVGATLGDCPKAAKKAAAQKRPSKPVTPTQQLHATAKRLRVWVEDELLHAPTGYAFEATGGTHSAGYADVEDALGVLRAGLSRCECDDCVIDSAA